MIKKIKVTPLGGVGEVGALNCMVYEMEEEAIVVDCGGMFPDQETLGVDLIIPDFTYLHQIEHKLKGLVLTHGHEDHIAGVPFLLQEFEMPVFGSPFTMGLIQEKLEEYPLAKKPKLHVFRPGDHFFVGSFSIDTIFVNHSILDASALTIQTDAGSVVHLTDWKIDKQAPDGRVIDLKKFGEVGKKGVLVLFSDSTNVNQKGQTLSEKEVSWQIKKICSRHPGRILITLFSSNIQRVQQLAYIARDLKRKLALVGRSMKENTQIARQLGSLSFDGVDILDVEETNPLPPHQVMLLVTGAQGEPRSVLTRMAFDEFKPFKVRAGDLVLFSSKMIPGNERNIFQMINSLCRRGAKVIYESAYEIHTSGHAHQDELKTVLKKLKPRYFVPIHGEYRHLLKHAELAQEWGVKKENTFVIENGQSILFHQGRATLDEVAPCGRVFVDGFGVGDVNKPVMRDRKHLADTGIVICVLMIDHAKGDIVRGPELISRGFIDEPENQELLSRAKKAVVDAMENVGREARTDMVEVQEEVRLALQRFFRRELDRKPMVIPVVQEV